MINNPHQYTNPQSALRSFTPLGQYKDKPREGGVLPRVYDLYMIVPPGTNSLDTVNVCARFGDAVEDVQISTLQRDYTRVTRNTSPLDEAAKRAIKHLFINRKK